MKKLLLITNVQPWCNRFNLSQNFKLGIGFTLRNCSLLSITGIPNDCNFNYGMNSEQPQCETSSICATIKVEYSSQGKY